MSENEMPERIWIEGPCVVTNDPSDQKYYVHEDKYDYLTDDYLTEYRRTPSLPDVMEDGEKLPGQTLNLAYLTVNINNGRSKPRIFVGLNYVTDFSGNRAMLCFHGEEAKVLFGFDPNETHHVQNNQIVKVER